jgi:hypothetical protein
LPFLQLVFLVLPTVLRDRLLLSAVLEDEVVELVAALCDLAIERGKLNDFVFAVELEFRDKLLLLLIILFVKSEVQFLLLGVSNGVCLYLGVVLTEVTSTEFD